MSSILRKKKFKTADVIMVLIIAIMVISGLIIALLFRDKEQNIRLNGTTVSSKQNVQEGLTCSIEIRCDTILENLDQLLPIKGDYVPENGVILEKTIVNFSEGETVFEVLQRVCRDVDLQLEYSWTPLYDSYYVEGINHLYEFDCGAESGWMYKVNGDFPNYGCSSFQVKEGDEIVWCFTCKGLGIDVGAKGF